MMNTPEKIYKALTMKLAHISLPKKIYNISSELKNNYFRIWEEDSVEHIFEIPPGMYSIKELVNVISVAVVDLELRFYYDKIIDRVYILSKNIDNLVIDFSHMAGCQSMDDNTTLGWALGFRLPAYTTESFQNYKGTDYQDIVDKTQDKIEGNWPDQKYRGYSENYTMPFLRGEAINMDSATNVTVGAPILDPTDQEDFVGGAVAQNIEDGAAARPNEIYGIIGEASPSINIDYVYVVVDDFNRNKNDEYMTTANKFSNVLAKIPLITRQGQILIGDIKTIYKQRTYFSPVNIEKLRVKILDRYGRKLDLGINTINATIEFDCEYS